MATSGTTVSGLNEIAKRAYTDGADMTLVAYTNTGDSLGSSSVAADLTQPTTAAGYAPIVLDGTWSSSNGIVTYVHSTPTNPAWAATGSWSGTVNGVAIIFGTALMHFRDLDTPFVAINGRTLAVDLATVLS